MMGKRVIETFRGNKQKKKGGHREFTTYSRGYEKAEPPHSLIQ